MANEAIWVPQFAQYFELDWGAGGGGAGVAAGAAVIGVAIEEVANVWPCVGAGRVGLHAIARIPPMRPNRNPMKRPPNDPTQLRIEKIMIRTPEVTWLPGFEFNWTAKIIIRTPQTIPSRPITPPTPPRKKVSAAPMAATTSPPMTMKIPPMRDRI